MATKKELIQAQQYSRRRLLTAFVSGAPGGKELEPSKPLRAVVAGTSLSVLIIIGSLVFGLIKPGLPKGWDANTLLIAKDSGARYVAINSVLYPVINTTSAQLVIPSESFKVLTVDQAKIAEVERGETIGIFGAPDSLPVPDRLISSGWASCLDDTQHEKTALLAGGYGAKPTQDFALVSHDQLQYVIADGHRYLVSGATVSAVLRALGLTTTSPVEVTATWLNLFTPGSDLVPLYIPEAGGDLPQVSGSSMTGLRVGSVVRTEGQQDNQRYVLDAAGKLAPLTPLAYELYLLGTGADLGEQVDVSAAQLNRIGNADYPAAPEDWPSSTSPALDIATTGACAVLETSDGAAPRVSLATPLDATEFTEQVAGVTVSPAGGALVRAINEGATNKGNTFIIGSSGSAFPVPGADDEILARLGYTMTDRVDVPQTWLSLFPQGPRLTEEAAGSPPETLLAESR
ncbi:type VII secretion protein EccB [Lysinibacter cavernae]|uniref:Type VII secretion protein EccB n=1 Tax=Lysinibacter cavernae TaxID=1640652 RepID=A0A7X5TTB3_9MICO|nr:type VII secretion protein EccB [Lysinibacter cavernae]NIH53995.1 type VII secretion protein EccB [Lysinibacter cavernae]